MYLLFKFDQVSAEPRPCIKKSWQVDAIQSQCRKLKRLEQRGRQCYEELVLGKLRGEGSLVRSPSSTVDTRQLLLHRALYSRHAAFSMCACVSGSVGWTGRLGWNLDLHHKGPRRRLRIHPSCGLDRKPVGIWCGRPGQSHRDGGWMTSSRLRAEGVITARAA